MVEKPVLFSCAMVLALLDGSKTQTRRIIKPQPPACAPSKIHCHMLEDGSFGFYTDECEQAVRKCPHPVGSEIWVKETFYDSHLESKRCPVTYRADISTDEDLSRNFKWKPSIFMPRKFSRITLEVTQVRVERLNSISEEDAKAEGVIDTSPELNSEHASPCFRDGYKRLWESINGIGSWTKNSFVWCYTFRRIKP